MRDQYPLAIYKGARPPAPAWFREAVKTSCASREVIVDGARVSYRQWGSTDKPGLLLVHGSGAHENWYDFIAPYFMNDFNVVAMTFSGMGGSDWRDTYSMEQFSADQMGVMQNAGMFYHDTKPIIAAHSLGGIISLATAGRIGSQLRGVVTIDTPIFPPDVNLESQRPKALKKNIFFPDQQTAISRFRLLPPQPCENHYILDHIARHSLKPVEQNGMAGWTWKLDPTLWDKIGDIEKGIWDLLPAISCKLAFMRGQKSVLLTDAVKEDMLTQVQVPFITIINAGHHVFLDNPLETISELQQLFAAWNVPA